ncbi:glycosyltransferase [Paludisphaera borealis]|uniref:glycosyltransferase n=1 Tax=Paludisphaera borealis TaxID=1387353 RepID=UPI000970326B|nr:glycosyltransferase [Paludisphaera borealis]
MISIQRDGLPPESKAGPLRVVHALLSLDVGGLERNVVNQVRLAPSLGQDVTVVCLERPGDLASQAEALGARIICLDKPPGIRLGLIHRIATVLRELGPQVVHTHDVTTLFYTGPAARRAGVPLVVHTEHGRGDYHHFRKRLLGRLAGLYARPFYCLTEDMAAWVTSHRIVPRRKIRLIFNGIDMARFREPCVPDAVRSELGISPESPVIGTVGRLSEIKRQDVLIQAFARIRQRVPSAHLILVGDGPLRQSLGELAVALGLGDGVHFVGFRPHSAPYLRAMDVFALTSRSEGMPQAVLEAQIVGVPVVVNRVGGLPELIDHGRTGLLVEPGNELELAESLLSLLSDPERRRQMSEAGRREVESRYDIGRMADEYHHHYLDLLEATH